jgi:hypothetical protein
MSGFTKVRSLLTGIVLAAAALSAAATADAATVTFGGVSDTEYTGSPYVEDGIAVTFAGTILRDPFVGGVGVTDGTGGGTANRLTFETDLPFRPVSLVIDPRLNSYAAEGGREGDPFDNVLIRGWQNEAEIWRDAFYMRDPPSDARESRAWTYRFPETGLLTSLTFEVRRPEPLGLGECPNAPCSWLAVRDVTLAPIPLPPAGLLLGAAVLGLALSRGRPMRRRAAQAIEGTG